MEAYQKLLAGVKSVRNIIEGQFQELLDAVEQSGQEVQKGSMQLFAISFRTICKLQSLPIYSITG